MSPADSTTAFPHFQASDPEKSQDVEALSKPALESMDRPLIFVSAIFVGMGVCLIMVLLLGFGVSELIQQSLVDGNWIRLALVCFSRW